MLKSTERINLLHFGANRDRMPLRIEISVELFYAFDWTRIRSAVCESRGVFMDKHSLSRVGHSDVQVDMLILHAAVSLEIGDRGAGVDEALLVGDLHLARVHDEVD